MDIAYDDTHGPKLLSFTVRCFDSRMGRMAHLVTTETVIPHTGWARSSEPPAILLLGPRASSQIFEMASEFENRSKRFFFRISGLKAISATI
jgi:hypothetical protein